MNADPSDPAETAWTLYNVLLGLTHQLWEAYELDFLMRFNESLPEPEEPLIHESKDLDFTNDDIPF